MLDKVFLKLYIYFVALNINLDLDNKLSHGYTFHNFHRIYLAAWWE